MEIALKQDDFVNPINTTMQFMCIEKVLYISLQSWKTILDCHCNSIENQLSCNSIQKHENSLI